MTRPRSLRARKNGFALIAVLWVMASVAVLGATLTTSARESVETDQNRVDLLRASWRAEACAEAARFLIDEAVASDAARTGVTPIWSRIDAVVARSQLLNGCNISLRQSGTTLDINDADSTRIRLVLMAIGKTTEQADSLVSALLDWRDADDTPRSYGAEVSWYSEEHKLAPRNGPLASINELRLVRGFDQIGGLETLFGVEDERIDLEAAPLSVLASLPGFGPEILGVIQESRLRGTPIRDLNSLAEAVDPRIRTDLLAHYAELVKLTTSMPETWSLTSRGLAGSPPLTATIELRLANAGNRVAIIRRRTWP